MKSGAAGEGEVLEADKGSVNWSNLIMGNGSKDPLTPPHAMWLRHFASGRPPERLSPCPNSPVRNFSHPDLLQAVCPKVLKQTQRGRPSWRKSGIERALCGFPDSLSHHLHDLDGKVGHFLDPELEAATGDGFELAGGAGDGSG